MQTANRFFVFLLFATVMVLAWAPCGHAFDDELLEPDKAFAVSARAVDARTVRLTWDIADGYYMYRSKFKFRSGSEGIALGPAELPEGKIKNDEFFGEIAVFRNQVSADIPIDRSNSTANTLSIRALTQGCADIGVCYPPHPQTVEIALLAADAAPPAQAEQEPEPPSTIERIASLGDSLGLNSADDELLPPEEAFRFGAGVRDANTLEIWWQIADDYYLYRDKIKLSVVSGDGVSLGAPELPAGKMKDDAYFGRMEVYYRELQGTVPLTGRPTDAVGIELKAEYQGCAERGVCYPPMSTLVALDLPPATGDSPPPRTTTAPAEPTPAAPATTVVSEQDRVTQLLRGGNLWTILPFMFLAGLGLAFTACVYPMIPILSSLIVGHGEAMTKRKAFVLSLVYVEAVALTYAAIGIASGALGAGVQAFFQNPWVLSVFALIFVLLALSMFGFYNLQVPAALQSRLNEMSSRQKGGSLVSVFVMGVLSALIVGPCAGPVLIGVLAFIGQEGDYQLGGLSLFALGNGLGAPLLLVGATGGQLLPKAGGWMDSVKAVFGVVLLGVAILMLERLIPGPAALVLWALLFIIPGIYLGALEPVQIEASGWKKLWKGLGVAMLVYGVILMLGAATGGRDVFRPLANFSGSVAAVHDGSGQSGHLAFKRIKSVTDLDRELAQAGGQPVMLDFYADWCTYCIKYEDYVFPTTEVRQALGDTILLQADVTASDDIDRELLNRFGVYAPPAILFFGADGKEVRGHRVTGYMDAGPFSQHVTSALRSGS